MLNIGIGIMCFGEKYYYDFADENLRLFLDSGLSCYVLTDNIDYFDKKNCKLIEYNRQFKSYHDKIILATHILGLHDVCVLLDADIIINDYDYSTMNLFDFPEINVDKSIKKQIKTNRNQ